MPLQLYLVLPIAVIIVGMLLLTASAFFLGFSVVEALPRWPLRQNRAGAYVHCRYCFFGRAHVREGIARVEDDDLVEVTCFLCTSCNLPQWRVTRSPVLKRAA
jgi:hypothetical protein